MLPGPITPFEYGQFISFFWIFILLITVLMLFLCYIYIVMRRSLERENESLTFSYQAIIGIETERHRISRELHDLVLPLIRDGEVSDLIRGICMELTPPDFSRLSIKEALADLCLKFIQRSGINCSYSIEEDLNFTSLSAENQLHLYRMVQESLNNIQKHSQAKEAVLVARHYIRGSRESILVCVSDDGIGLSGIPEERSEKLGMRSLRQRSVIMGAQSWVHSLILSTKVGTD